MTGYIISRILLYPVMFGDSVPDDTCIYYYCIIRQYLLTSWISTVGYKHVWPGSQNVLARSL